MFVDILVCYISYAGPDCVQIWPLLLHESCGRLLKMLKFLRIMRLMRTFFFGGGRVGAKTRGKLAHWRCHSRCDALCQHEGFEATRRRGRTRLEGQLRLVWDWYLVCEINGNRPFICRPARSSKINTFIIISTRLTGGHGLSYVDHPAGRHPWLVQDATHVKVESGVGEDRSAYWFHCHHSEHHATRSCRGPQNLLILRTSLFSPLASEKKLVCHVFQVIM